MTKATDLLNTVSEGKVNLDELDYLEIIDMSRDDLRKYSKDELIAALKTRCYELEDQEKKRGW